jgi:hypothetical protein
VGRHKISNSVLRAQGAFKHRPGRDTGDGPLNDSPLGNPPENFTADMRATWLDMARICPEGVLSEAERPIITNFCRIEADIVRKMAEGVDVPSALYARQESILGKLGMTPGDRSRVGVAAPRGVSDFDDL